MNARTRRERTLLRHRRRGTAPYLILTLGNGATVKVWPSPLQLCFGLRTGRASYRVKYATVYGPWPPTSDVLRELGVWS